MALSKEPQAQQDLKTYLALLDMTSRQNLLKELQEMFSADRDFPKWPPSVTSSSSEGYPVFWNLLYAKNMRSVRVPVIATSSSDVHARGGERTQSGRGGEDNNGGTAEGQQQKSQRGLGHQGAIHKEKKLPEFWLANGLRFNFDSVTCLSYHF